MMSQEAADEFSWFFFCCWARSRPGLWSGSVTKSNLGILAVIFDWWTGELLRILWDQLRRWKFAVSERFWLHTAQTNGKAKKLTQIFVGNHLFSALTQMVGWHWMSFLSLNQQCQSTEGAVQNRHHTLVLQTPVTAQVHDSVPLSFAGSSALNKCSWQLHTDETKMTAFGS